MADRAPGRSFTAIGSGYGVLYPVPGGLAAARSARSATGYASLKVLQAFVHVARGGTGLLLRPAADGRGYALLAAALALASPLILYSGIVMTEALIYPVGALALLAMVRAVETRRYVIRSSLSSRSPQRC